MKTQLRIFAMLSFVLLLAVSPALSSGTNYYVAKTGNDGNTGLVGFPVLTIQHAISIAGSGNIINIGAGTYNEAVSVNNPVTLIGADSSSTFISPPSGNGISVSSTSSVTIEDLTVTGASDNGIYAHNVLNLVISNVNANYNGASGNGSGIYIDGITGSSSVSAIQAKKNQLHGISIGDGSSGVTISNGTFTGNGVSGNTGTGGGINIHSVSSSGISNITVNGPINSSSNMNAGIIIFADPTSSGSINTVSIGTSGTVTLTGNGSGTIGEGVAIAGNVTTVNITAQFTQGSLPDGAGVAVVGTDNTGSHSPSGVTISGSTFSGYGLATPAITLASASSSPTYISTNPVTATGNTIGADGFQTEDLVYHKLDNASLGLVTTDASNLYVTTNSGSIQRGINAATTGQTVNVGTGYYTESLTLNKAITLAGVDTSAKDHPASGVGITVTVSGATVKNLVVDSSLTDGISASGLTSLSLWGVVSRNNAGSGAQLSNCGNVTITNGSYSNNTHEGINAVTGSSYAINGTTASSNGTSSYQNGGSGIDLVNITGPSWVTNVTASLNYHHGISISNGSASVHVAGGTFTWNGIAGNAATGGGVNVLADSATNATTSSVTIRGTVNASNNTTAGIYIFCSKTGASNQINTVTIGDSGSVTLTNNGSTGAYNGGAGVVVYGRVINAHISNTTFTKGTNPGVGLANLGDNTTPGSPSGTQVSNSTFNDYTSAKPAVTLTDGEGDISTVDVSASNNTFRFPVAVKVFLQGPYNGTSMNTALGALIPTSQQPYNVAPWSYAGTEHVATIPASTVDWILLELRSATGDAAAKRAAFLKSDGTLIDTSSAANVSFTQTLASGYTILDSIVVMHRNHIAVISASSVTLPNEASAYDFTSSQSSAHGTGQIMAPLTGGLFGLWCGDTDASGNIDGGDRSNTWNNRNLSTYIGSDTDLSGTCDGGDRSNTWNNRNVATQVPNFPN